MVVLVKYVIFSVCNIFHIGTPYTQTPTPTPTFKSFFYPDKPIGASPLGQNLLDITFWGGEKRGVDHIIIYRGG